MMVAATAHSFTFAGTQHNVYHCAAGEGLPRHEHDYPHVTACHAGRLAVRKEHISLELTAADAPVVLKAGEWHELEALEAGTVFENIFAAGN